ncbi:MAG: carboxypeptidase-like regulatory domain-containing protein [Spirosomataceae bacterium]
MKNTLLLIFITVLGASGQGGYNFISGKIIDKSTQKAISGSYISIPNRGVGTTTNINGEFKFYYPRINTDSSVVISQLGYKNFVKKASAFDSTNVIELEPAEFQPAVTALDAKTIVKNAIEKIKENFNSTPNYQTGFYLETTEMEKVGFVQIKEGVLRIERQTGTKAEIMEKVKLLRSRKYEWPGQLSKIDGFGLANGTAFVTRSLENGVPEFLEKGNLGDYNFTVDSLMNSYNNQPVYSISFSPVSKRIKAARNGKIYIDQYTEAIVRIEYEFTPEGIKDVIKSSIMSNTKKEGKSVKAYTQFTILNGKWQLQQSQISFVTDFEGKLDNKYKSTATLNFFFVVNESFKLGPRSAIKDDEILLTTENFPKAGLYEDKVWGTTNYIIPTEEMREIVKKSLKK